MRRGGKPPVCATWLLAHLSDRYRREALLGDLVEEYWSGRTDAWYWWQTLGAVGAGARSRLIHCRPFLATLLTCWSLLIVLALLLNTSVILVEALDPSLYWLIQHRRRRAWRAAGSVAAR